MNKKSKEFDIKKGKKGVKVITELEGIKEEAQNLPREDVPTHEEDLILVQALLPKVFRHYYLEIMVNFCIHNRLYYDLFSRWVWSS